MRVAIVGGTGPFGKALAARLHGSGVDVIVGSRDADAGRSDRSRARLPRRDERRRVRGRGLRRPRRQRRGARSTRHASCAIRSDRGRFSPSPPSFASPRRAPSRPQIPAPSPSGSRPSSTGRSSSGLHSLAAASLGADEPPDEDAFVCGDDADAKAQALDLAERLTSGRALDAGPLASARALEGFTAVIVNMNRRYKGHAGIRVTGLG